MPNPAEGIISIHGNNMQRIILLSMLGNILEEKRCNQSCEFDLSTKPAGIYYIKVITNDRVFIRKIVRI